MNATITQENESGGSAGEFFTEPSFAVMQHFQYYYPATEFGASQNMLVPRNQNNIVLVDSGSGENLKERIRMINIMPADVTAVLVTHAHRDHIVGLLDESQNATFPNARTYIHRLGDEFWRQAAEQVAEPAPLLSADFLVNPTTMNHQNVVWAYASNTQLLNDLGHRFGALAQCRRVDILLDTPHTWCKVEVRSRWL